MSICTKILFLVILSLQTQVLAARLDLQLDKSNLNSNELHIAEESLQKVSQLLPRQFHAHMGQVMVQFVATNDRHMGHAQKGLIQINRSLLNLSHPLIENRSSRHVDTWNTLLASLIHEVSHLYDMANLPDPDMADYEHSCQFADRANRNAVCKNLHMRSRTVSQNWSFLNASGWWVDTGTNHLRQGNYFKQRSPDHYEFQSPEETFAVNMEYFLLDSQFKCRRPVLYKNLARLLSHEPAMQVDCDKYTQQVFLGNWDPEKQNPLTKISFDRLYEIHWLHAGQGRDTMSRFGHSMLRLILCAPERQRIGPECLNDTRHHIVLTYRASVEESTIKTFKGLNGYYPSILFIQPFSAVSNTYTRDEFRELFSYPLKISRDEMKDILDAALEAHWSYEGKYYFLSNNCAVETINLLKRSLSEKSVIQSINSIRPDALVEMLKAKGLLDTQAFKQRPPYFYQSKLSYYATLLEELKKAQIIPQEMTLNKWLETPFEIREGWLDRAIAIKSRVLAGHIHLLEVRAASLLQRLIRGQLFQKIEKSIQEKSSSEYSSSAQEDVNSYRLLLAQLRSAGHILGNESYGRPSQQDVDQFFNTVRAQELAKSSRTKREAYDRLIEQNRDEKMISDLKSSTRILNRTMKAMGVDLEAQQKFLIE